MTIENLEIKQSIDKIKTEIQKMWDNIYPIGSIYILVLMKTLTRAVQLEVVGGSASQYYSSTLETYFLIKPIF